MASYGSILTSLKMRCLPYQVYRNRWRTVHGVMVAAFRRMILLIFSVVGTICALWPKSISRFQTSKVIGLRSYGMTGWNLLTH